MTNTNQTTTTTGTKYDATRDLDIAQIAKLIRSDLKAAGYKASVRISRYSMGQSVDVEIKALPKGSDLSTAVVWVGSYGATDDAPYTGPECIGRDGWFRPAAPKAAVEEIVNAYNRVSSDSQTDYYNSKFHASVDFSSELKDLATAAAVKAMSAPKKTAQIELMERLELI